MTETMTHCYSSDSTQQGLSNEYQHDKVYIFKNVLGKGGKEALQ